MKKQQVKNQSGIVYEVSQSDITQDEPFQGAKLMVRRIQDVEDITWRDLEKTVVADHIPDAFSGSAVVMAASLLDSLETVGAAELNDLCAVFADSLEENGYSWQPFLSLLRRPLAASPNYIHGVRRRCLRRTLHVWLGYVVCLACGGNGTQSLQAGRGPWNAVLCPTCNPDEEERKRGNPSVHMGWVK